MYQWFDMTKQLKHYQSSILTIFMLPIESPFVHHALNNAWYIHDVALSITAWYIHDVALSITACDSLFLSVLNIY